MLAFKPLPMPVILLALSFKSWRYIFCSRFSMAPMELCDRLNFLRHLSIFTPSIFAILLLESTDKEIPKVLSCAKSLTFSIFSMRLLLRISALRLIRAERLLILLIY